MSTSTVPPDAVDFREYVAVLRRRKWWIVAALAMAVATAVWYGSGVATTYTSSATLLVKPITAEPFGGGRPDQLLDFNTERALAYSEPVTIRATAALAERGLEPDGALTVSSEGTDQVMTFSYQARDAGLAQAGAQAYAEAYLEYRRNAAIEDAFAAQERLQERITRLQAELAEANEVLATNPPESSAYFNADTRRMVLTGQLIPLQSQAASLLNFSISPGNVIGPAGFPGANAPNRLLYMVAGLMAGLFLGVVAAFVRDRLDDRVRTPDDLPDKDVPVLATVPRGRYWDFERAQLVTLESPRSAQTEAYRWMRSILVGHDRPSGLALMVSSALPREGKSTVAANLSVVMAEMGCRTLLISADLRRPSIHDSFELPNDRGLGDLLDGGGDPSSVVVSVDTVPGLSILPSGRPSARPADLLISPELGAVMKWARAHHDVVIMDAPPVLAAAADCIELSRHVDSILFVVKAGYSRKPAVDQARAHMRQTDVLVSTVLWNAPSRRRRYTRDYYASSGPEAPFKRAFRNIPSKPLATQAKPAGDPKR